MIAKSGLTTPSQKHVLTHCDKQPLPQSVKAMTVDFLNLKPHCQNAHVYLQHIMEWDWQERGTPILPHPRKIPLHKLQESLFAKLFKADWEACLENKEL